MKLWRKIMKKIEAVIRHHQLENVKEALAAIGVTGMTVSEAKGFGRQRGHKETYRGAEYTVDFVPKVRLEVVVREPICSQVVEVIGNAARTGKVGDGKIFVSDLSEVIRIRTGEINADAI
jgi:nitrogen regulatory protein P-II 1